MTGSFDFDQREARVRLFIRGAAGMLHGLEAAVDTGFTEELTLDAGLIEALQLPYVLTEQTMLSDAVSFLVRFMRQRFSGMAKNARFWFKRAKVRRS